MTVRPQQPARESLHAAARRPPALTRWPALGLAGLLLLGLLLSSGCAVESGSSRSLPRPPAAQGRPSGEDSRHGDPRIRVVEAARSQIGAPYRAGGCDPDSGYDCSGLVHWAFAEQGASLPRRSADLLRSGRDVSGEPLLPADLLFYDMSGKGALHVGIYTGQGTFIHSPTSGGSVREESIDAPWWRKGWVGARRVLAAGAGGETPPAQAAPVAAQPAAPARKPASPAPAKAEPVRAAKPATKPTTGGASAKTAKPGPTTAGKAGNASSGPAPVAAETPAPAEGGAPRDPAVLQALEDLRSGSAPARK